MQMSDSEHISKLVSETVLLLCKNYIDFNIDLKIQGLIAVTSDSNKIHIIEINDILENAPELGTCCEVHKESARVPVRCQHVMPLGSLPNRIMALNAASKRSVQRYSKSLSGHGHLKTESVAPSLASQHLNSVTQESQITPEPTLAEPATSDSISTGVPLAQLGPPNKRVCQPNISSAHHVAIPVMHASVVQRMKTMVHQGRHGAQVRMPTPMKQSTITRAKSRVCYSSKSTGFRTSNLRAAWSQQMRRVAKRHMSAGPLVMPSPRMVLSPPLNAGGNMQQSDIALCSPGNLAMPLRMPHAMSMSVQSLSPMATDPIAPRMLLSNPAGNQIRLAMPPQITTVVPSQAMVSSHLEALLSQSSVVVTRKESQNVVQLPRPITSPHFSLVQQSASTAMPRIIPLMQRTISSTPIHDTKIVKQKMLECSQLAGNQVMPLHMRHHDPLISPKSSSEMNQVAAPPQIIVLSASGDKLNSPKNANQFPQSHFVLQPNQRGNVQLCRPPLSSPNTNFCVKLMRVLPQRCIEQPSVNHTSTISSSVLGAYDSSTSFPTTLEAEIKSHYVVQKGVSSPISPATCASTIKASNPVKGQIRTAAILPSESRAFSASLPESTMNAVEAPVLDTTSSHVQAVTTSPMPSALSKSVCFDQSKNTLRQQNMLVTAVSRPKLIQIQTCQQFAVQRCELLQSGNRLQPPGRHVPIILTRCKKSQSAVNLQHCGDLPVSTISQQKGEPVFLSPQNMIYSVGNHAEQSSLVQSQQNLQSVTPVQQSLQPILHSSQNVSHLTTLDLHQAQSSQPLNLHNIIAVPACFQQISQLEQNPQSGKNDLIQKLPANEKERHSGNITLTTPSQMPVVSNSCLKLESETSATCPEQNSGAQYWVLCKVCPVQLLGQQTIAESQQVKILPTSQQTVASSVQGDVTTAATIENVIPDEDLDMPKLSPVPVVPLKDNWDLSEATDQISQSAQANRPDMCRSGDLDKHHLESPTHNLVASVPNILVTQSDDSADVLLNTQLCKSQSNVSKRENFLKPSSRSFVLNSRSACNLNSPEKQNVGTLIDLPSTERAADSRFNLDAAALSQEERWVKMRCEERLKFNMPDAERTSPNFQPSNPLAEQMANEKSFATENDFPSIVWTSLGDASPPSPSSTIAYSDSPLRLSESSDSPLRLSGSDLEEYEQNLSDTSTSNDFNQSDEENDSRLRCRCSGCSFASFDAIGLARHYTKVHTGDICVDAVISDRRYMVPFSATELEISRDKANDHLCPFQGCGCTFPSTKAVCSHHLKAHKTSLHRGQRIKIVAKFRHVHQCVICQHGFAAKACLIQHLKQHRNETLLEICEVSHNI